MTGSQDLEEDGRSASPDEVLVVGDIQGDSERLIEGLRPYPDTDFATIFLGDFFQGGRPGFGGGAKAARIAARRGHSQAVMGNHDLMALGVLDRMRTVPGASVGAWEQAPRSALVDVWLSRRGDWADIWALFGDDRLAAWVRNLPVILRLSDGTIVQHCDDDRYLELGDTVEEINSAATELLAAGGIRGLMPYLVGRHAFDDEARLDRYLARLSGTRLVHGHTHHSQPIPKSGFGGKVYCFDGMFSRYWVRSATEAPAGPIAATIGLLPRL